ncbi:Actin [Hexamita inflata]|nr:Actin [Hexamita inflata]
MGCCHSCCRKQKIIVQSPKIPQSHLSPNIQRQLHQHKEDLIEKSEPEQLKQTEKQTEMFELDSSESQKQTQIEQEQVIQIQNIQELNNTQTNITVHSKLAQQEINTVQTNIQNVSTNILNYGNISNYQPLETPTTIDFGSHTTRIGVEYDFKSYITCMGSFKKQISNEKTVFYADAAYRKKTLLDLQFPITNNENQIKFLDEIINTQFPEDKTSAVQVICDESNRKGIAELLFEKHNYQYVQFVNQLALNILQSGKTQGHVINAGGFCHSAFIYENRVINYSTESCGFGAIQLVMEQLREHGIYGSYQQAEELVQKSQIILPDKQTVKIDQNCYYNINKSIEKVIKTSQIMDLQLRNNQILITG